MSLCCSCFITDSHMSVLLMLNNEFAHDVMNVFNAKQRRWYYHFQAFNESNNVYDIKQS